MAGRFQSFSCRGLLRIANKTVAQQARSRQQKR
jgi:hypothetical protein